MIDFFPYQHLHAPMRQGFLFLLLSLPKRLQAGYRRTYLLFILFCTGIYSFSFLLFIPGCTSERTTVFFNINELVV